MNDFTTLLITAGRMEERLREADRARLATLARRAAPRRPSLWARLLGFRRPGLAGSGTATPRATHSTVARPC